MLPTSDNRDDNCVSAGQELLPNAENGIDPLPLFQIVANSFLANLSTSALFATILVEYLLERLPEMGSNVELSNLYLKLFKLVFGSVSLFAAENEQMLKVRNCHLLSS